MGYGAVVDAVGGSGGGGVSSGRWLEVAGETGEDENEEDEAVFAAVVGEGELFNAEECVSNIAVFNLSAPEGFRRPRRLRTYLYLSSASSMTPTASLTCACTLFKILVSTSSARNASSLSCKSRHTCRRLGTVAAAAIAVAVVVLAAASSAFTPPLAAGEPLES